MHAMRFFDPRTLLAALAATLVTMAVLLTAPSIGDLDLGGGRDTGARATTTTTTPAPAGDPSWTRPLSSPLDTLARVRQAGARR